MRKHILLCGVALCASASVANATPIITASLFTPVAPVGSIVTPIEVNGLGIATPSQAPIIGTGYMITFTSEAGTQGLVNGTQTNQAAVPIAGMSNGSATYLTGDYNSDTTTNVSSAGNYLSSGTTGEIIISFTTAQTSLALLWGSIDTSNFLTLSNGDTVTGAQVQLATANFVANGFQGAGGSAYVSITDTPFTSVTLTSGVVAFEADGVAGSNTPFSVPEPISISLLGMSLAGLGVIRKLKRS